MLVAYTSACHALFMHDSADSKGRRIPFLLPSIKTCVAHPNAGRHKEIRSSRRMKAVWRVCRAEMVTEMEDCWPGSTEELEEGAVHRTPGTVQLVLRQVSGNRPITPPYQS